MYRLISKMTSSSGFDNLEMYVISKGNQYKYTIKEENGFWKTIDIKNVAVKAGKVEIGFLAQGTENTFSPIDDVLLVKNDKK